MSKQISTRRRHALLGLTVALLAPIAGCQRSADWTVVDVTPVAGEIVAAPIANSSSPRLVGVASCTASGCHGGGKPGQIVGSEYNIWISEDPHAEAFSVLYEEASIRMLQLLDGETNVAPYHDQRCLSCHSTTFAEPRDEAGAVYSDGVGCEACHGPAERWLGPHVAGRLSPATRTKLGIWNTDQLHSRTRICADCHVGGAGREVNHDLIAAGHPRLQFEMGAYLEALPKHWDESRDRGYLGSGFDAVSWAVGQVVTSQVALDQLSRRAAHGEVWPELSEWSCSACHHDLRDDYVRQESLSAAGNLSGRSIAWDDWNHFVPRHFLRAIEQAFQLPATTGQDIESELAELQLLVQSTRSDRSAVTRQAAQLAAKLAGWSNALEQINVDRRALDLLSYHIVADHFEVRHPGWEAAAQVYDAVASMHQSRLELARSTGQLSDSRLSELTTAIADLYQQLVRREAAASPYQYDQLATDEKLDAVLQILRKLEAVQQEPGLRGQP